MAEEVQGVQKVRLVAAAFAAYRDRRLSPETPTEFVEELRDAYYSGAAALFDALEADLLASDWDQEDVARVEDVKRELVAFGEGLTPRDGYAGWRVPA